MLIYKLNKVNDLPFHLTIDFLNFVKVPALFTSSFSVFHSILALMRGSLVHIYLFVLVEAYKVP